MSDCMTQEDAMNMNNKQAIQILTPFCDMLRDQNGCPISDAYFAMKKAIEALKEQQWIPVSERLPEYADFYLTSTEHNSVYCDFYDGYRFQRTEKVIAWMPLPKSYRGDEDGE